MSRSSNIRPWGQQTPEATSPPHRTQPRLQPWGCPGETERGQTGKGSCTAAKFQELQASSPSDQGHPAISCPCGANHALVTMATARRTSWARTSANVQSPRLRRRGEGPWCCVGRRRQISQLGSAQLKHLNCILPSAKKGM